MDWKAASEKLSAKLDKAHVKPPSQFGPKGDYIEGWHAIAEANRIFGFGGWSYTILSLDKASLCEGQDSKGNPQWQAAYTCIVRVTVDTVTRDDVGFGSGFAKQVGDAVEGATKEAVTDALKRALRTFGNPFGLALYDKSRENVGDPAADAEAAREETEAAALVREIGLCQSAQSLMDLWTRCASDMTLKPLLKRRDVVKAKDDAKARLAGPDPFGEAA